MIDRSGEPLDRRSLDEPSFDEFYEHAACGYLSLAPGGVIVRVNETFAGWTGRPKSELLADVRFQDLLTPGGMLYFETHCAPMLAAGLDLTEVAVDVRRVDGTVMLALLGATVHRGDAGQPDMVRLTVFDASHRRGFERHLVAERDAEREARRYAEALGRLADRLAALDTLSQIGAALAGELVGGDFVTRAELLRSPMGPAQTGATFTLATGGALTVGTIPVHGGGAAVYGTLRIVCRESPGEAERLFLESAAEVAGRAIGRIRRADAATRAARGPSANGLPNERWWTALLKAELRRAGSIGLPLTVVVVELRRLEQVTLTYGFEAADAMLLSVTNAWRAAGFDLLSRFGGEEFAVLMPGLQEIDARHVVARAKRDAGASHAFSAGVAQWDGSESPLELLSRAEAALREPPSR